MYGQHGLLKSFQVKSRKELRNDLAVEARAFEILFKYRHRRDAIMSLQNKRVSKLKKHEAYYYWVHGLAQARHSAQTMTTFSDGSMLKNSSDDKEDHYGDQERAVAQ